MTHHWLVIDLRQNHIAIGYLYENENQVEWHKKWIQYWLDNDNYDTSSDSLDLSFYRSPGSKTWKITRLNHLNTLDESFEKIPSLFDEQIEFLEKNLGKILFGLAKGALSEFETLPILILCDRFDALPVLKNIIQKLNSGRPEGFVFCISPNSSCLDGFALLDTREQRLPQPGSFIAVRLNDGNAEEIFGYCWNGKSFTPSQNVNNGSEKLEFYGTRVELERAGAALYAIHWRSRMAEQQQQELSDLRNRINEKEEILVRVKSLIGRLNLDINRQRA